MLQENAQEAPSQGHSYMYIGVNTYIICVYMCIHTKILLYKQKLYACVYTYKYLNLHTFVSVSISTPYIYVYVYIHIYTCIYTYVLRIRGPRSCSQEPPCLLRCLVRLRARAGQLALHFPGLKLEPNCRSVASYM